MVCGRWHTRNHDYYASEEHEHQNEDEGEERNDAGDEVEIPLLEQEQEQFGWQPTSCSA